jgi:hypothetical protein
MSESTQELLNRLLRGASALEWQHELRAFAKSAPARIAEIAASIKAAAHDGRLTPEFAATALQALEPEDASGHTILRSTSDATFARHSAAPDHTQLRDVSDATLVGRSAASDHTQLRDVSDVTLAGRSAAPDHTQLRDVSDVTLAGRSAAPDHTQLRDVSDVTLAAQGATPERTLLHNTSEATSARQIVAPEQTQQHNASDATLQVSDTERPQLRTLTEGTMARETRRIAKAPVGTTSIDNSFSDDDMTAFELSQTGPTLEPGAVVKGRFLLEKQIGRGGMGLVFAAIDRRKKEARDPNPHIAIKILYGDFQRHQDSLIALQREARKAQTLAHPNVVTVFDFDRDGPTVFMTMELLRGRSLDSVIREARGSGVGRKAALPIIRGIAEGLAYAHRKGIVHSDLKPGNVFLLEDGTPKLLDFGIARAVPSPNAEYDVFDAGSLGAYTEAYATQEMVEGVDPHTADDVYALGLIAYELLAGEHPYRRHSAVKARELGIKPQMPRELTRRECRVLEAALAFDRSKRPKDAAEFLSQFFGATRLQKVLVAAVVVLTVLAGVFAYRDYRQSGPTVAFEDLAPATQQQFTAAMSVGDTSWSFYARDRNVVALYDAVDAYADAYRLHPRNRKASSALQKSADALLEDVAKTPEQRKELAMGLMQKSELLAKYEPVVDAAR